MLILSGVEGDNGLIKINWL